MTFRSWNLRIRFDFGLILAGLLAMFAVFPLLMPGLPNTADGPIHFYRAVDMRQAWQYGVLYPRWSANLALGYGTPLFNFAPPLLYILMMLLNQIGLDLALAMKMVIIAFVFVAALGSYLLGRDLFGEEAGLIVCSSYVFAPYRLRELYIQGNYAQFLGLALYPLILWSYYQAIRSGKARYVVTGILSYAALLLSHNISAMIFTPFLVVCTLFWLAQERMWASVRNVIITTGLGLGLAAFFWVPAFYERRWIQLSQITKGHFDFRLHFLNLDELFAPYTPLDFSAVNVHLPRSFGWSSVLLAGLGVLSIILFRLLPRRFKGVVLLSSVLLLICMYLMLPASTLVWEHAPLLRLAEFPWRMLGMAAMLLAILAGAGGRLLMALVPPRLRPIAFSLSLAIIIVPAFFYLFPRQPFVDFSGAQVKDIIAYELRTKAFGTTSAGEFLPIWVAEHPTDSPMIADYEAGRQVDKLDRTSVPPQVYIEEYQRGYTWNAYRVESGFPFTLRFNTLWFPGWVVYLDGKPIPSTPSTPQGLIQVDIPWGAHYLKVSFETTPVRIVADAVSAVSVFLLIGYILWARRHPKSPVEAEKSSKDIRWKLPAITIMALLIAKEGLIGPLTDWFRLQSPPGTVIGVQHPAQLLLGDQARFLGYDFDRSDVAPGQQLTLRVYWQALPGIKANFHSFVHLDALPDLTTVASSDAVHPGGVPMTTWPPTMYGRDEHRLAIPAHLPPGMYLLRAGLYHPETGERLRVRNGAGKDAEDAVLLQGLRVRPASPVDPAALPKKPETIFAGKARLLSYQVVRSSSPSQLDVALYWQATEPIPTEYKVFVHVLDEKGNLIAQSDTVPLDGRYPTIYWLPGEIIEDRHVVALPANATTRLQIAVGLYDPTTLNRAEARDAAGTLLPDSRVLIEVHS